MQTLRKSAERGYAHHGWLESFHSFSFADYHDPAHMGWGNLRVINEDFVAAHRGFGTHGHRDMEIVTYVLEGELSHRDSMGNGEVIRPGEVQRMTAGTGVQHSEMNHGCGPVHLLQIWILPAGPGLTPGYEQLSFDAASKRGRLRLVAAPGGHDGAVTLHADAHLWAGLFDGAEQAEMALDPARKAYVHLARGQLEVNGQRLNAGDALALQGEAHLSLAHGVDAEVLVFDLAA